MKDKSVVEKLMEDYGLNQRQAKYVMELAKTGNKTRSYMKVYEKDTPEEAKVQASRLSSKINVKQAHISLLREFEPERAEDFRLSKQKVLEDLEAIKVQAAQNIQEGKGGGGAYSGYVRASELQGRELGMFAQKHHHQHEHTLIPDEMLLRKLAEDDPELARSMADHLGVVIDGEFEEIEDAE